MPADESRPNPCFERLEDHERDQLRDYLELIASDPEAICHSFNPSRRAEFARLLARAFDIRQDPG